MIAALPEIPADLWSALGLTLRLSAVTSVLLLAISLPLAGWLQRTRSRLGAAVEAATTLPIVLPPTVIGFYLLLAFGNRSPVGRGWSALFGLPLAFSFWGLVIGSMLYSLPYAIQPIQGALRDVDRALIEAAVALGARRRQTFWGVLVPAARNGVLTAGALAFAHTMGEFGVVLMLGGNIPGVTRVASIALYDETQKLNYPVAHAYALILLGVSLVLLTIIALLRRRGPERPMI